MIDCSSAGNPEMLFHSDHFDSMTDCSASRALLSIIVPCFNEGAAVRLVHDRLVELLGDLSGIDPLRLMRELPLEAGAAACWRAGRPAGASRRTSRGAGAPRRTRTTC